MENVLQDIIVLKVPILVNLLIAFAKQDITAPQAVAFQSLVLLELMSIVQGTHITQIVYYVHKVHIAQFLV
jgi:hypothetical protein